MKHIYCDVCKREIVDPIPHRTFFTVGHVEFCEPCRDDMEAAVKGTVRVKAPFDYSWYDDLRLKVLEQGVQKGKIDFKRAH